MGLVWAAVAFPVPGGPTHAHLSCLHASSAPNSRLLPVFPIRRRRRSRFHYVLRLTANSKPELEPQNPEMIAQEVDAEAQQQPATEKPEIAAVREALRERREKKKGNEELSVSGVLEEVAEIEWPVFGRVLGTTGVVLAVIAGSSLVLLTVNALLAEISDRVFSGKGVQDFFS